jgi:hypothetical protein
MKNLVGSPVALVADAGGMVMEPVPARLALQVSGPRCTRGCEEQP